MDDVLQEDKSALGSDRSAVLSVIGSDEILVDTTNAFYTPLLWSRVRKGEAERSLPF